MIVTRSTQFKKDYMLAQQQGKNISKLDDIISRLGGGNNNFDGEYKVYSNDGRWMKDYFVLYIEPNWVLVYRVDTEKGEVLLARTSHPKDVQ